MCVDFIDDKTLKITSKSEKFPYEFSFDKVFDMESKQQDVFDFAAKPIINSKIITIT